MHGPENVKFAQGTAYF